MKIDTAPSILSQAFIIRFGKKNYDTYYSEDSNTSISVQESNRLLLKFLPQNDFFEEHYFTQYQDNSLFWAFKGSFFRCTLPLLSFKLFLLEDILLEVESNPSAFEKWTDLFNSLYHRSSTAITARNMEWEAMLNTLQYIQEKKITL